MDKTEQRIKTAKKLEAKIGRPAATEKEKRVRAAAVAQLTGEKQADVSRSFGVTVTEINRLLKQTFPNDLDRYEFLEDCMMANAVMAMGVFQDKHKEMSAPEAAKSAVMFGKQALEIRKARETGFKEQPLNVSVILRLEQALTLRTGEKL